MADGFHYYPFAKLDLPLSCTHYPFVACPYGSYKVALVMDPGVEFHWYRQDADGFWSHKRGHLPVTRRDASNHLIVNPQHADRNYGDVNYTQFCDFYCVPGHVRTACSQLSLERKLVFWDYFYDIFEPLDPVWERIRKLRGK